MSAKRSEQLTPLECAAEIAKTGKSFVDGLSRLQRMLYERSPAGWRDLHDTLDEFEQGLSFLEYEGLIAATDTTERCLKEYFAYFRSRSHEFRRAVSRADQLIGRQAFLDAFKPGTESESTRGR